jgi:hypothetical protein
MKVLFFISFFAVGCKALENPIHKDDNCNVIHAILGQKDINNILGLEDAKKPSPYIRIFDLTGIFQKCSSLYKSDNLEFPIPYHVERKLSPSMNTGTFRDIVFTNHSYNKKSMIGSFNISLANFETSNNVNTNFKVLLKYTVDSVGNIQFFETKVIDYIDKVPVREEEYLLKKY